MPKHTLALVMLLSCLFAAPTTAQTTDAERIRELEAENARLRAELAQMRLEMSQLKKQLAKHAGPAEEEQPDNPEPGEEEEGDKPKVKTYRSADDILRSLPQDMKPDRKGWDVFKRKTVTDWLTKNITGGRYEARRVIKATDVAFDRIKKKWKLKVEIEPEPMRYMNWEMNDVIEPVYIYGEQAEIEKLSKRLRPNSRVRVFATIGKIEWDHFGIKTGEDWRPKACELTLTKVEFR